MDERLPGVRDPVADEERDKGDWAKSCYGIGA